MEFSRPESWSGSLSLLQGIFPTQGSNPGLPHCRWILYQLSHKGSPRILEWVAYPFSSGSSQPRNRTGVSCIAGRFFTNWAIRDVYSVIRDGKMIMACVEYNWKLGYSLRENPTPMTHDVSSLGWGVEIRDMGLYSTHSSLCRGEQDYHSLALNSLI